MHLALPTRGRRPVAAGLLVAAVLTASPFAVAATGDVLRQGVKNGPISKETEIIGKFNYKAVKGGYVTRQSNTQTGSKAGGAAIYGCRTELKATPIPCMRANNLAGGHAFQFNTSGDEGGTITTGNAGGKPFTTNATGIATGLNADRVDGMHAAELVATAQSDTMWAVLDADGTLVRGQGASSPSHTAASGVYRVTFAQDLDGCSTQVSIARPGTSGAMPDPGTALSAIQAVNHQRAEIRTFDMTGAASDRPVSITVNC